MNQGGLPRGLYLCVFAAMVLLFGSMAFGAPDSVAGAGDDTDTMFSLIVKGGVIMIPIFIASIVALAIAVERFISLRRGQVIPDGFMDGLSAAWGEDHASRADAIAYCESIGGTVGSVFKAGILRLHKGEEAAEKAIEDAGYREADKMKRSLKGLSIVASISPLLGLLGTVYGMISAFQSATVKGVESVGADKMENLARGIYEALVTTAAGLTVAIPVLLLYQILNAKVDRIVDDLDEMGLEFIASHMSQESGHEDPQA